jgi:hypothetical protein
MGISTPGSIFQSTEFVLGVEARYLKTVHIGFGIPDEYPTAQQLDRAYAFDRFDDRDYWNHPNRTHHSRLSQQNWILAPLSGVFPAIVTFGILTMAACVH